MMLYSAYFLAISIKRPWPCASPLPLPLFFPLAAFLPRPLPSPPLSFPAAGSEEPRPASADSWQLTRRFVRRFREQLFLAVAVGGACFSLYLLYVIKVILKEFCIVCFSFHMANFSMLVLAVLEYNNPEIKQPPKKAVD